MPESEEAPEAEPTTISSTSPSTSTDDAPADSTSASESAADSEPAETAPERPRRVVITGATNGIGREAAEQLAARGAEVVLVARDRTRGEATLASMRAASGSQRIELLIADLSLMSEVRRLADELTASPPDVLVNNAGVKLDQREMTSEGNETMLAVNHLAPYLLARRLEPVMRANGGGRIINVNSFLHKRASSIDDLQSERGFSGMHAYSTSKLVNLLTLLAMSRAWATESGDRVTINAYNPGFVRTNMTSGGFTGGIAAPLFAKSARTAAKMVPFLALSPRPDGVTGAYYLSSGRTAMPSTTAQDTALQDRATELTDKILAG